ncbi:MAG: HAD family hydrolase [Candidatus Methanomethylophilaceae archaeon]|nr:HAD family hydrolase [Candidatus Methanomethylophilaceae archaeon]
MDSVFKAVGFDLDGTFLRTHVDYSRLNDADRTILESLGIPFDEIDFGDAVKRQRHPIRNWLESNGRGDEFGSIDRMIDDLCTEIECEFVDEAEPFPGSVECIDIIRSKGLRVGILTRGSRGYAETALGTCGLTGRFDAIVGRDYRSYDDAKPSPVAMFDFARELGVEPSEILYLGDNVADYLSARDAGAAFVGVLSGACTAEDWRAQDPDMVVVDYAGSVVDLL